ncbi:DNA internalization-related competence protein ComEC/Rec2 [Pseudomonas sp. D2-30]|uniref:DNA internalization-related competence protein ComEC/Rec2 n=1 Tax=unclassified Pseudomonas TaxID=196821 RepID=UPI003DA813BB
MRTAMVALALGLLAPIFLPALPPSWLIAAMTVAALLVLPTRTYWAGLFFIGLAWACFCAQLALDDRLSVALEGETRWVEGRVVGLPQQGDGVVRFELADAHSRRTRLPASMRLAWYGGPLVSSGETWRLAVKLKRPAGLLNPHGFDYEAWLLSRGIGATGTVKDGSLLQPAKGAWRDGVRQALAKVDAQGRSGALLALILGDGAGLSREEWRVLQDTGTVHLLVISGQHIGLLAGLVYLLVAGAARYGVWPARLPWLPWACALAFAAALGYGLLAGLDVPVRRACAMIGLVLLWRLRFRQAQPWWAWMAAFVGVLVLDPLASLRPGFWLSFAAVAILMFTVGGRLGPWRWWQTWTRAQWFIALGLCPLLLILGLPVSLSGPLINLLAVPWISLLVLPSALLGTALLPIPFVGESLLWIAGGLLDLLFNGLGLAAGQVPAWVPLAIPLWAWCIAATGALLLLLPEGVPLRLLGWPMLLLMVFPPRDEVPPGQAEVWQLDVGQGLAILVRTHRHTLLYDAGPRFGEADSGERVVVPTLHKLGVEKIDLLLLSHADADHAGGAQAVRNRLPTTRVISGDPQALPGDLQAGSCDSGESWAWDGVRFELWRWDSAVESNQKSCVLVVMAGEERLLLTGDIDTHAERALLEGPLAGPIQWLAAPHHGSRSSSSMALLARLKPHSVLISRGRSNAFGHPHPWVIERYRRLGLSIFDSAEQGAIRLQLGAFAPARTQAGVRRYWRDRLAAGAWTEH